MFFFRESYNYKAKSDMNGDRNKKKIMYYIFSSQRDFH